MIEPATSFDTRFSEQGSAATPWETALQVAKAVDIMDHHRPPRRATARGEYAAK